MKQIDGVEWSMVYGMNGDQLLYKSTWSQYRAGDHPAVKTKVYGTP